MAVRKYLPGEHPGGFIGYRVTITYNWNHLRDERYFSANKLGWADAETQAHATHNKLYEIAQQIHRDDLIYRKQSGIGPHVFAPGFRANLQIRNKRGIKTYSPQFIVDTAYRTKRRSPTPFYVTGDDIATAYREAVDEYVRINRISAEDAAVLMAREPTMALFNQYLVPRIKRAHPTLKIRAIDAQTPRCESFPSLRDFEFTMRSVEEEKIPVSIFSDHLILFHRTSIKNYVYVEYRYDECGGIKPALELAKSRWEQVQISIERKKQQALEREAPKHPAEFVRRYHQGHRFVFAVCVPGFPTRTFSGFIDDKSADLEFTAYRTAIHYAKNLLIDGYVDEQSFRQWRKRPVYLSETEMHQLKQGAISQVIENMKAYGLSIEDLTSA